MAKSKFEHIRRSAVLMLGLGVFAVVTFRAEIEGWVLLNNALFLPLIAIAFWDENDKAIHFLILALGFVNAIFWLGYVL